MKRKLALLLAIALLISLTGCGETEEQEEIREKILATLEDEEILPATWEQVGWHYEWTDEWVNYDTTYNYYIDSDKYDDYEYYWNTDDLSPKDIYEGYNDGDDGKEWVFHCVKLGDPLKYSEDTDYMGVYMTKDQSYYPIYVYETALYYKYCNYYKDADHYYFAGKGDCEEDSLVGTYILHEESGKWIIEEASDK